MKNPELFHKTVAILVKAYQTGTLVHLNCYACAVGNLVAAHMGFVYKQVPDARQPEHALIWSQAEGYSEFSEATWFMPVVYGHTPTAFQTQQMQCTGYNRLELKRIEKAFESVADIFGDPFEDQCIFNGLMAVVDCLMQIHRASEKEGMEAKAQFTP